MIRTMPLILLLAACADFPEVGRAEAEFAGTGTTPPLLTAEELARLPVQTAGRASALSGEAAALQARARLLRAR